MITYCHDDTYVFICENEEERCILSELQARFIQSTKQPSDLREHDEWAGKPVGAFGDPLDRIGTIGCYGRIIQGEDGPVWGSLSTTRIIPQQSI
jgi:hypothetical protein